MVSPTRCLRRVCKPVVESISNAVSGVYTGSFSWHAHAIARGLPAFQTFPGSSILSTYSHPVIPSGHRGAPAGVFAGGYSPTFTELRAAVHWGMVLLPAICACLQVVRRAYTPGAVPGRKGRRWKLRRTAAGYAAGSANPAPDCPMRRQPVEPGNAARRERRRACRPGEGRRTGVRSSIPPRFSKR